MTTQQDTPRQQQRAAAIRRVLAGKRLYVRHGAGQAWRECGPLWFKMYRDMARAGAGPEGFAVAMADGRKG